MRDYSDIGESLQSAYSIALGSDPERLHFAAHSHHLWPDCTREAQIQAWQDAATLADEKWDRVFGQVVEKTKSHLARILGAQADQLCLAPNTHEFVYRLFSCFPGRKHVRVLTSDSEFHSFSRQIRRLEEENAVVVERVAVEPFETFSSRWETAARKGPWDLVFISQVFFNSGHALRDLASLVKPVEQATAIVVDGYHAFCALPLSLGEVGKKIFYLAGGYKYAQAGEGICFLSVPSDCSLRPVYTGWFAAYHALESGAVGGPVPYDAGGARFAGATMDFSAAYRFNAVQDWWQSIGLTVETVHRRVSSLKREFVALLEKRRPSILKTESILRCDGKLPEGHFVVFQTPDAGRIAAELKSKRIIVDYRGDRLRFGFGLYHDRGSLESLFGRLP